MFRRRRVMALVLMLAMVAGVVLGVRAIVGAVMPSEAPVPPRAMSQPVDPDTVDREPTETELANPVDCRASAVQMTAEVPSSVATGARTPMPVTITNEGRVPCLLDVGSAELVTTIYSGDDLVWSSAHCASGAERRILLDVGASDTTTVRWPGTRSAEGCPDDPKTARSGTYRAVFTLVAGGSTVMTETEATFRVS